MSGSAALLDSVRHTYFYFGSYANGKLRFSIRLLHFYIPLNEAQLM